MDRTNDQLFKTIIEVAPYGAHLYELKADGRLVFTWANRSADQILGVDNSQFIGKTIEEAFPALYGTTVPDAYWRVAQTGNIYEEQQITYHEGVISGVYDVHAFRPAPGLVLALFRDITEAKKAELKLTESQRRLALATDSAGIGIWDWDIDADHMVWDERMFQIYGIVDRPSEYGVDFWAMRLHPDDKNHVLETLQAAIESKSKYDTEFRILHQDQTVKYIKADGIVLKDEPRKTLRMIGVNYDITEQKKTEVALRESTERFKSMFNEAPLGIAIVDSLNARFYLVNPAFSKITGLSEEELLQIDWISLTYPDDIQADLNLMTDMNAGKIPGFQLEKRYLHRDGYYFWVNITVAPLYVEEKIKPRHLLMIENITKRKKNEEELKKYHEHLEVLINERTEALRESHDRIKLAMEAAAMGTFDWNLITGRVVWAPETESIWGLPEGGYEGTYDHWKRMVYPADLAKVETLARHAVTDPNTPYSTEHRIIRPDGTVRWIFAKAITVRNNAGQPIRMIGLNMDITARKQAEEELHRYRTNLEEIVKERTYKLTESQQRLTLATASAGIGIWDWNIAADRMVWDDRMFQLYGISEKTSSHLSTLWEKALHPDDRPYVLEKLHAALDGLNEYNTEFRILHQDRTIRYIKADGLVLRGEAGDAVRMTGVSYDITEQKKAEAELRNSEMRFRLIFENVPVLIDAFDNYGQCVLWNNECKKTFGWTKEEINSHDEPVSLFYPDQVVRNEMLRTVTTEPQKEFREWHPHTKEGKVLTILWANFKLYDGTVINIGHDITQRKKAEEVANLNTERMNSLLKLNQMASSSLGMITDFAMKEAVRLTRSQIGYLAFINEDEKVLTMHSCSKKAIQENLFEDNSISSFAQNAGFWEDMIRQRRPVIINDEVPNEYRNGYPADFEELRRHMSVPVFDGDHIVLVVGVGNKESDYDESDVRQLTLLMDGMWRLTERKRSEEALYRRNRELRALSDCNQVLVRAENERQLLYDICNIIHHTAGYVAAWVGFINHNEHQSIKLSAFSGDNELILKAVSRILTENGTHSTPTGHAAATGTTVIVNDLNQPGKEQSFDVPVGMGLRSAITLPLADDKGTPFGILTIYSEDPNAFTPDDVTLLRELGGDLAYGIGTLRNREKRLQMEQNLKTALAEREALILELYHRTKNNMQVISGYLEIQRLSSQDEKLDKIVLEMVSRINAMALVHEKLYKSKNLSLVDMQDYLGDLISLLAKSHASVAARVNIRLDAEPLPVSIDIAISCGLVVTEFLTNSFKYAFPGQTKGTIVVQLKRCGENQASLVIADNGIGKGLHPDISKLRSLGIPMSMNIVKRQLSGSVNLDTSEGYRWNIVFRTDIYSPKV